jgi:hypothetical protein
MMARKLKIDEGCEELSVVADPWNLKLKPAKLKDVPFLSEVHSGLALVSFS